MSQTDIAESQRPQSLGNVLVATDFSPGGARAVARAARLPIAPGSAISIVHVLPGAADAKTEAATRRALAQAANATRTALREAGRTDVDVFTHVARGKPFVEIIGHARDAQAYLIVVGRHGQRPFRDLLIGSTAERVIRKGTTPVLIVDSRSTSPYRRPLVAVDGSEISRRAFELALQVAGSAQSFDVVHSYGAPYESGARRTGIREQDLQEYGFETGKAARAMVEAFLASCQAQARSVSIVLRRGDPRLTILRVAAQRRADLLALGTHGRSGLAHVLIGSGAEAVVRAAPCDVLVARPLSLAFTLP
jgi:nucleotide-binding universal stress UspA family protein